MYDILVVVAHPDDEVLGCGGFIAKSIKKGLSVKLVCLADGVSARTNGDVSKKELEERRSACKKACLILGLKNIEFYDFQDNQMDQYPLLKIVQTIEKIIKKDTPSIILTHFKDDLNIDHQIVNKATTTACRPEVGHPVKKLLFFEVHSSTEWQVDTMFCPNWFEDISPYINLKLDAMRAYKEELKQWPHPRSIEGIEVLAKWRGATVGLDYAEAFKLGRIVK